MSGAPDNKPARSNDDIRRIKDNLYKILSGGGSEDDADRYLASEGATADEIRNSPVARTGAITSATPTAEPYKPTTTQRAADLARASYSGTKAPALP